MSAHFDFRFWTHDKKLVFEPVDFKLLTFQEIQLSS